MRKQIYNIVHVYEGSPVSIIYKWFMIVVITTSLIPLMFKETNIIFRYIDIICLAIYIVDYILRWITADYKFGDLRTASFVKFPLRFISLIDLMSIFALLCSVVDRFNLIEIAQVLTVFRVVRIFRYSKSMQTISEILARSKKALLAIGSLAVGYIVVSAIIIFNVEPDSFGTFFDALYWATISLTAVGYGDIYPVTVMGRTVAMLSSFFGIAIVALPAGIVTAEYIKTVKNNDDV